MWRHGGVVSCEKNSSLKEKDPFASFRTCSRHWKKYKTIIEDLNYERDIVNLYFMWLYITSTNRQGWDRDGSMAHHGIKKSRPDWILHIMTKTIKTLVYYTFVVIHQFLKNKKVTWVTNRNEWWNCVHVYY